MSNDLWILNDPHKEYAWVRLLTLGVPDAQYDGISLVGKILFPLLQRFISPWGFVICKGGVSHDSTDQTSCHSLLKNMLPILNVRHWGANTLAFLMCEIRS